MMNILTIMGMESMSRRQSCRFKTIHVEINDIPMVTMETTKNLQMSGVAFDVVGVFSDIMSMKTVIARRVVTVTVTLSPVCGGRSRVRRLMAVMKQHGPIRLLK